MYEDLKIPSGRPVEDSVERKDLTGYMLSAKLRNQVVKFFKYWDRVVANRAGKDVFLVHNMENFFGEILDKFEEMSESKQRQCFTIKEPFRLISESTNLKLPKVFQNEQDNKDFISIFLSHKFEKYGTI